MCLKEELEQRRSKIFKLRQMKKIKVYEIIDSGKELVFKELIDDFKGKQKVVV